MFKRVPFAVFALLTLASTARAVERDWNGGGTTTNFYDSTNCVPSVPGTETI